MNMKKINLLAAVGFLAATSAFAHGVEKILPADGHNAQVLSAELDQVATGETLVCNNSDGPVYEPGDYVTKLGVTVTYQSNDDVDAPATGSGPNGEFLPSDNTLPEVTYEFDVTQAQIDAIKAGTLDPKSLVSVSIAQQTVQISDPNAQNVCNYDDNGPTDGCVEPAAQEITVSRPVLSVWLNQ
jgi:hypothetical protein